MDKWKKAVSDLTLFLLHLLTKLVLRMLKNVDKVYKSVLVIKVLVNRNNYSFLHFFVGGGRGSTKFLLL